MDSYVGVTAPILRGCWAVPVGAAVFLISNSTDGMGLYLSGLYFLTYSTYCIVNFARCREAHCIITGVGWGALAAVTLVAAVMRFDWLHPIWNAFLIVFVVGHGFELIWAATRHTHALRV